MTETALACTLVPPRPILSGTPVSPRIGCEVPSVTSGFKALQRILHQLQDEVQSVQCAILQSLLDTICLYLSIVLMAGARHQEANVPALPNSFTGCPAPAWLPPPGSQPGSPSPHYPECSPCSVLLSSLGFRFHLEKNRPCSLKAKDDIIFLCIPKSQCGGCRFQ